MEASILEVSKSEGKEINYLDVPDFVTDIKQEIISAEQSEPTINVESKEECLSERAEQIYTNRFLPVDHVKNESIKKEEILDGGNMTEELFSVEDGEVSRSSDNCSGEKLNKPSENSNLKCEKCDFRTCHENKLRRHTTRCSKKTTERRMHVCEQCDYKTHKIGNYKRHLLSHRSKQGYVHKCLQCQYQTSDEFAIYKHMVEHPNSNNTESTHCPQCDFQTFDNIFGTQILQDVVTIDVGEMKECYYQKCQRNDKVHVFSNESVKEVTIYKCAFCKYQTKRKGNLTHHSLRHKNVDELVMFACTTCPYQSFNKTHLQTHLLSHKSDNEVQLYKCTQCEYHSKYKADLKVHALRHKNPAEVPMFKCIQCPYQAIRKCDLNRHSLRHKGAREVKMHQCPECQYKTFDKGNLNKHIYRHKIANKGS